MKTLKMTTAAVLLLLSLSLTAFSQTAVDAGSSGTYSGVTNNVAQGTTNSSPVPNLTYLDFNNGLAGVSSPTVYFYVTSQNGALSNTTLASTFTFAKSIDASKWTTNRTTGTTATLTANGLSDVTSVFGLDMKGSRYVKLTGIELPNAGANGGTNYNTNIVITYKVQSP